MNELCLLLLTTNVCLQTYQLTQGLVLTTKLGPSITVDVAANGTVTLMGANNNATILTPNINSTSVRPFLRIASCTLLSAEVWEAGKLITYESTGCPPNH